MSVFDPDTFLGQEVDAPMPTRYPTIPDGDYVGSISKIAAREFSDNIVLDVTWELQDAELAEQIGMDRITVRQSVFLDVDADGTVAEGDNKNVSLGRLRSALNQNDGTPWNFNMLVGAGPATVHVVSKPAKDDPETIYNNVTRVNPLS